MNGKNLLERATSLVHSSWLVIFFFFFLDVTIVSSSFDKIFLHSLPGKIFWLAMIPVRIALCAGIYGMMVEIASGAERVITFPRIEQNAKKFWKVTAALLAVPWLLQLFYLISFSDIRIPQVVVSAQVNFLLLFILSYEIIVRQYGPWPLSWNIKNLSLMVFFQALGLYAAGMILALSVVFWGGVAGSGERVILFFIKYLVLVQFVFWVELLLATRRDVREKFSAAKELILISPQPGGIWMDIALMAFTWNTPFFAVLKILTPKDYHIREYHRVVWRDRYYASNKLVAIGCYSSDSPEAYKIAKEFRRRGSKVVMGGPHVSFVPDEALAFCDSVVIGEVEGVWRQIIEDYERGCLKPKYWGGEKKPFDEEVYQGLLAQPPEIIRDCLELSRGCKFQCHFCSVPALQPKLCLRPIDQVVCLLAKVRTRYKVLSFFDNNVYADPGYAKQLFQAMKPLKIKWATQSSIDIAQNDEVLNLAKESGCQQLLIGYEIAGTSAESERGGKFAMAGRYVELTKKIKQQGIAIKGNFIFGFDNDNFSSFVSLWKWAFKIFPTYSAVNLLTPFPGTAFYYQVLKEDRVTNLNWRNYLMCNLIFQPKRMNRRLLGAIFPPLSWLFFFTTCRMGWIIAACLMAWGLRGIFL